LVDPGDRRGPAERPDAGRRRRCARSSDAGPPPARREGGGRHARTGVAPRRVRARPMGSSHPCLGGRRVGYRSGHGASGARQRTAGKGGGGVALSALLLARVRRRLFDGDLPFLHMSATDRETALQAHVERLVLDESPLLSSTAATGLARSIVTEVLGCGPLEGLLEDGDVS